MHAKKTLSEQSHQLKIADVARIIARNSDGSIKAPCLAL
jgi:hypothetical protein